MEISTKELDGALELSVRGRLDAYWAEPLSQALEETVRAGAREIRLNLVEVSYISSVGIRVLLKFYKQLRRIDGTCVVSHPSDAVKTVLELAGLRMLLGSQAIESHPSEARGARQIEAAGIPFEVYNRTAGATMTCRAIGDPSRLSQHGYDEAHVRSVSFPNPAFGVGIGAFGSDFADCRDRFGEFVAAAGAAAYLPTDGGNVPDYIVSAKAFVPELRVLYALACQGTFAGMARFAATDQAVSLSRLARAALDLTEADTVALVAIAESAGLVGATLRHSPAAGAPAAGLFHHPEVRSWLSFSPERCYSRSLSLVVGVATRTSDPRLEPFVRPLMAPGNLRGHFHAAAFSYHPLANGMLELPLTVAGLFETETLQAVIHLIGDDRHPIGAGESELVHGACWFAPVAKIEAE